MASPRSLPYVDPLARRGPLAGAFVKLAGAPLMGRLSRTSLWRNTIWRIDPLLLRLTRGRVSTGLALPTALLETRGARSGLPRRNGVIYFHDGDRVTVIPSQAGAPANPAWFHNALANPDVRLAGRPYRAELVSDEQERQRLWRLADRVFPGFAGYRETAGRSGRSIPILQLVPR
jgi:deazaflavin-dependent oxidoreductase (nitroreductase family)